METLAKIEESNRLLVPVTDAIKKLKEFVSSSEVSDEGYLLKIRELERAVAIAHSKWSKFAEQNFWAD